MDNKEKKGNSFLNIIRSNIGLLLLIVGGLLIIGLVMIKIGVWDYLTKKPDEEGGYETLFGNTSEASAEAEDIAEHSYEEDPEEYVKPGVFKDGEASYYFRTGAKYFEVYDGSDFKSIFMKGVNMGVCDPGYFPGELGITERQYLQWFKDIAEMNANCIRVYTIQNPSFYEAFYKYNSQAEKPLYLFHGTWFNEDILKETNNAFDEGLRSDLLKEEKDTIDIIHGNCVIEERPGHAFGTYTRDISPWVAGWILGIESEADFVDGTNKKNPDKTSYKGRYFTAEDVSPFEVFWAETSDEVASYEMEHYGMQRPMTYTNWPTTDMITHPSESMMDMEDSEVLNIENIKPTQKFKPGQFASYHIYPYYPNFMYTDETYASYIDDKGKTNTYMAYLRDLASRCHLPLMVGEFGVPSCKGLTHTNILTGFDQGNHDETEQGKMLASMINDIHEAGYAGGLVFTWQDEWFKRTWNTMDYTDPYRRAYWNDVMTNEQHFGILDFVPGEDEKPSVVVDGKPDEWNEEGLFIEKDGVRMYVNHDCAYLYLMLQKDTADGWDKERVTIPVDVTDTSGSMVHDGLRFDRAADFLLEINGKNNTRLLVQEYYDRFLYSYKDYKDIVEKWVKPSRDSDIFTGINYLVERPLHYMDREGVIPLRLFDGGIMIFGNTDYDDPAYNSIADFCYSGDTFEIRIPWLLLNFRDPSTKEIEDDFWVNDDFSGKTAKGIYLDFIKDGSHERNELKLYNWQNWDTWPYFERLRKSYYILQDTFKALEPLQGGNAVSQNNEKAG